LELLQAAAANRLAGDLARDGGLQSALWAGTRRRGEPAQLRLAVGLAHPSQRQSGAVMYRYEVTVSFPGLVIRRL
jgi:predicted ATPase